jgi:rod shape-determining protein MreC
MPLFRRELRAEAVTAGLVLVSLLLIALPESRQTDLSRSVHDVLLLPFTEARARIAGYVGLREENERLRAEVQRARLALSAVQVDRAQREMLRRQLGFAADQPVRLLPTRVVDRDFQTLPTVFLVDVGHNDGVRQNLPVVTAEGLVGKTVEVGPSATRVMLFTHPDFSASALLVGGDHLEYGVVRPTADGELQLYLPLRSTSAPGDRIVTSGYGATFPRGIPLGRVARVLEDRRLGLQRIDQLDPVVALGRVTHAFVLLRTSPPPGESAGEVLRLFWPGYAYPPMTGETLGEPAARPGAEADSAAAAAP